MLCSLGQVPVLLWATAFSLTQSPCDLSLPASPDPVGKLPGLRTPRRGCVAVGVGWVDCFKVGCPVDPCSGSYAGGGGDHSLTKSPHCKLVQKTAITSKAPSGEEVTALPSTPGRWEVQPLLQACQPRPSAGSGSQWLTRPPLLRAAGLAESPSCPAATCCWRPAAQAPPSAPPSPSTWPCASCVASAWQVSP